jgi:hypothetical protein
MPILDEARLLGRQQQAGGGVLVELAMRAARAAVAGEVDADDATTIYLAYIGNQTQPAGSRKAQVSKLRQIIKLAAARKDALTLLTRVTQQHQRFAGAPKQLYEAMVDAARSQLKQAAPLSDEALVEIIRRPPRVAKHK